MNDLDVERGRRRCIAALDGVWLGDAFGERFFGPIDEVRRAIAEHRLPPAPWAYTDDTAMALSVAENLIAFGQIDRDALATQFRRRWAADPARGYGAGAARLMAELQHGATWGVAAQSMFGGAGSMGNGAAMRAAPIGAYFGGGDLARVVTEARRSAEVTHAHPEGIAGAIAVAVAAALFVDGISGAALLAAVSAHVPDGDTHATLVRAQSIPIGTDPPIVAEALGSGQLVLAYDTVPYALHCAASYADDFAAAMWATVSGLGDRDTTCAIVGGIIASRAALPDGWRALAEPYVT